MSGERGMSRYEQVAREALPGVALGDESRRRERYRELVVPLRKPGRKTALLKFMDTRFEWYYIPLGTIESRKMNEAPRTDTVLVPVVPVTYATPDLDPGQATAPRPGGWIYIYRGGYLWRELEVLPYARFRDVNLHEYAGRDERPATVEHDSRIIIPWTVGGEELDVWMAYSEVQWSWARINALGGMDPEDFRVEPGRVPMPEDQGVSRDTARRNREARMQRVELSGYLEGFPALAPEGRRARREPSDACTCRSGHLKLHHESRIPVVYLHDPLGIAFNNAETWWALHGRLRSHIEAVRQEPFHESAFLAWHVFFNEALWQRAPAERPRADAGGYWSGGGPPRLFEDNSAAAVFLRRVAMKLDRAMIEELLQVEPRKALRQGLRELARIQAQWLQGRHDGQSLRETCPDFVDFNTALLDYASLPAPAYARLWSAFSAAAGFLALDPAGLDGALDLPEDRRRPGADPGREYLLSVLAPDHPLHPVLFPAPGQVDVFTPWAGVGTEGEEDNDGSGRFRPQAFARSLAPSVTGVGLARVGDGAVRAADRVVGDLVRYMKQQLARARDEARKVDRHALVRLALATGEPMLEGVRLVPAGEALAPGEVVLGMRVAQLLEGVSEEQARGVVVEKGLKGAVRLEDAGGNVVGYMAPEGVPRFTGLRPALTPEEYEAMYVRADGEVRRARVELLVGRMESGLGRSYAETLNGVPHRGVAALQHMARALPPLVAVLEVFNLQEVVGRAVNSGKWKDRAQALVAMLALAHANTMAAVALVGKERTAGAFEWGFRRVGGVVDHLAMSRKSYYADKLGKAGRAAIQKEFRVRVAKNVYRVTGLSAAGAVLAGAGAVMSLWDAVDLAEVDDADAAAWSGVAAGAQVGLAVAIIMEGGGTLLGLGVVGWVFLALTLVAVLMVGLSTDTPLEKWAKHGPFARDKADRLTHEYENATPAEVYQSLLGLLMSPTIELLTDPSVEPAGAVVEVWVPGFRRGKEVLDVRLTAERWWVNARGQGGHSLGPQELLAPVRIRAVTDEAGSVLGYRYYYRLPEAPRVVVRACARRITGEQFNLPAPPVGERPAEVVDTIREDMPGWTVAGPLKIRP